MNEALAKALTKVRKDHDVVFAPLSQAPLAVESVSTGNLAIDSIVGVGGLPLGRIVEFFGLPSSGKTTAATMTAAQVQAAGKTVIYLDFENSFDYAYAIALGLDPDADTFLLAQPDAMEPGFNAVTELIETGCISMVVVDSIAGMTTLSELNGELARTFSDKALLLSQALRRLNSLAKKHNVLLVFLNHLMEVVDTSAMGKRLAQQGIKQTTTPGGRALKYHASVRLEFKQVKQVKGEVDDALSDGTQAFTAATDVQVTVVKNKVAAPFRKAVVRNIFGHGFSNTHTVLGVLVAHGLVRKNGAWYSWPEQLAEGLLANDDGEKIGYTPEKTQGEDGTVDLIDANPEWRDRLTAVAAKLVAPQSAPAAPAEVPDPEPDPEDERPPEADPILAEVGS